MPELTIQVWQITLPFSFSTINSTIKSFQVLPHVSLQDSRRPKCTSNNNEWKQRLRECGNLLCNCQYANESLCCHKYRPFSLQLQREITFIFKLKKKFSPWSKFPSFKKLSGAALPFTCFIYMRNTTERDLRLSTT